MLLSKKLCGEVVILPLHIISTKVYEKLLLIIFNTYLGKITKIIVATSAATESVGTRNITLR